MTFCIACQIGSHDLCKTEPNCNCECTGAKHINRELSPSQLADIERRDRSAVLLGSIFEQIDRLESALEYGELVQEKLIFIQSKLSEIEENLK